MTKLSASQESRVQLHRAIKHALLQTSLLDSPKATAFDVNIPRSLQDMLETIREYELVTDDVLFVSVVYIQRYLHKTSDYLSLGNVRALFLIAIMVASKFMEDIPFDNLTFARLGCIPVSEVNRLELVFLQRIEFNLNFAPDVIQGTRTHLMTRGGSGNWAAGHTDKWAAQLRIPPALHTHPTGPKKRLQPANV